MSDSTNINIPGGSTSLTKILRQDEAGNGGGFHEYAITDLSGRNLFAGITFQKGPIKSAGMNGCQNEDLIGVVIDRLECFQAGECAYGENHVALALLYQALSVLNERTADRKTRGVEGTNEL